MKAGFVLERRHQRSARQMVLDAHYSPECGTVFALGTVPADRVNASRRPGHSNLVTSDQTSGDLIGYASTKSESYIEIFRGSERFRVSIESLPLRTRALPNGYFLSVDPRGFADPANQRPVVLR